MFMDATKIFNFGGKGLMEEITQKSEWQVPLMNVIRISDTHNDVGLQPDGIAGFANVS